MKGSPFYVIPLSAQSPGCLIHDCLSFISLSVINDNFRTFWSLKKMLVAFSCSVKNYTVTI